MDSNSRRPPRAHKKSSQQKQPQDSRRITRKVLHTPPLDFYPQIAYGICNVERQGTVIFLPSKQSVSMAWGSITAYGFLN